MGSESAPSNGGSDVVRWRTFAPPFQCRTPETCAPSDHTQACFLANYPPRAAVAQQDSAPSNGGSSAPDNADYGVVVLTGRCAGDEVTFGGVPWRGDLSSARALVSEMEQQAARYGHTDASYAVERQTAATPCECGHLWSSHDAYGCQFSDGCKKDGTDA